MSQCKNCGHSKSKKKQPLTRKPPFSAQAEYQIARVISADRIRIIQDDYLLQIAFDAQSKAHKLQKEVRKLKEQLRLMQKSRSKSRACLSRDRNDYAGMIRSRAQQSEYFEIEKQPKSRLSAATQSKNRQPSRIDGPPQRESRSSSHDPGRLNSYADRARYAHQLAPSWQYGTEKAPETPETRPTTVSISRQTVEPFGLPPRPPTADPSEPDFRMYVPSYNLDESSLSSNLLSNEDPSQRRPEEKSPAEDRAHLERQFQELIIMEKTATPHDRKAIRAQIRVLQQRLSGMGMSIQ